MWHGNERIRTVDISAAASTVTFYSTVADDDTPLAQIMVGV